MTDQPVQNTFNYVNQKFSKNEKILLACLAATTVMTVTKIQTQHKQIMGLIDVAGKAMRQLETLYTPVEK